MDARRAWIGPALAWVLVACGDDAGTPGAGGDGGAAGGGAGAGGAGGHALAPAELADDTEPYALLAGCEDMPEWPLPVDAQPERVAAVSAVEAYVVTASNVVYFLAADGSYDTEPLVGVTDVWRCPGVTWAVGFAGLVARKPDGGSWETLDAGFEYDLLDGGVGCDGDVWIGGDFDVRVYDGTSWRVIATKPTVLGGGVVLEHDVARVRGAGRFRVATSNYGDTLAYFPEEDLFVPVGGTDDLVSDVVQFRDGTGATLYHGHALRFDRDLTSVDGDSPLDGVRVARRSDDDLWITQSDVVRRYDGGDLVEEPLPDGVFAADVDARVDAVWTVGFGGVAVRTQSGFCRVATTTPPR